MDRRNVLKKIISLVVGEELASEDEETPIPPPRLRHSRVPVIRSTFEGPAQVVQAETVKVDVATARDITIQGPAVRRYADRIKVNEFESGRDNLGVRDRNFVGREGYFEGVHTRLAQGGEVMVTQMISGLGGIGKTSFVKEYGYRGLERGEYKFQGNY